MPGIKAAIKSLIPASILDRRAARIAGEKQKKFGDLSVADAFSEIYKQKAWGESGDTFFSGSGSEGSLAAEYARMVGSFIAENHIKFVVDLGCGDMRVSEQFITPEIAYVGCDVVPDIIEYHRQNSTLTNADFRCLNIIEDDLPDGDLCLIRQVLQHLSNDEICRILAKAQKFPYVIVTEHYPADGGLKEPNLDIPHGPGVRLQFDSAVVLDQPPFNVTDLELLLDLEAERGTRIKSFLIKRRAVKLS